MSARSRPDRSSTVTESCAAQFKRVSRDAGLRFVADIAYRVHGSYLAQLSVWRERGSEDAQSELRWRAGIKPLVLDDILWAAFLPQADLGGERARLNLKVRGGFTADPLPIGEGVIAAGHPGDLDGGLRATIDQFDCVTAQFIDRYPGVPDYLIALGDLIADSVHPLPRHQLRQILALIAADRPGEAAALADAQIAAGETGPFSGPILGSRYHDGVFQHLALSCKPAHAARHYLASRTPTHRLQLLAESDGYRRDIELARGFARHRRVFARLRDFTGASLWGLILTPLPDSGPLRYLQAAGRAEAMTLEICTPNDPPGEGSTRYVIGHDALSGAARIAIELPYSTEVVWESELFVAEEAIGVFETYYDTGVLDPRYPLRPVERHPCGPPH
ncbi:MULTISPECIES: hypothetical protein [Mycobacterium]|uniref:hypothetical protein n=1 Tax=Mycobacterium TaxID=1763 RepID=UPI001EE19E2B|nr:MULTISPECIES: hypothetical protein [Mycobacterium]